MCLSDGLLKMMSNEVGISKKLWRKVKKEYWLLAFNIRRKLHIVCREMVTDNSVSEHNEEAEWQKCVLASARLLSFGARSLDGMMTEMVWMFVCLILVVNGSTWFMKRWPVGWASGSCELTWTEWKSLLERKCSEEKMNEICTWLFELSLDFQRCKRHILTKAVRSQRCLLSPVNLWITWSAFESSCWCLLLLFTQSDNLTIW